MATEIRQVEIREENIERDIAEVEMMVTENVETSESGPQRQRQKRKFVDSSEESSRGEKVRMREVVEGEGASQSAPPQHHSAPPFLPGSSEASDPASALARAHAREREKETVRSHE